ncbi:hypothetical protein QOT17_018620 [Balamuthia mandrillaris]
MVVEDYWIYFHVYRFVEWRCHAVRTVENPNNFAPTIGRVDDCRSDEQFYELYFNELLVDAARLQLVDNVTALYNVHGIGNTESNITLSFEVMNNGQQRNFTNAANTTRAVDIPSHSLKISFEFRNYQTQVLSQQEVEDGSVYSGFVFDTHLELSHTVLPFVYTTDPVYAIPMHPLFASFTQYKVGTVIKVVDDLFRVQLSQCVFSLNNPPTASKEVFSASEWGFEAMDTAITDYNVTNAEPYASSFGVSILMNGGIDVLYDPDLSILLTPSDGEDGGSEPVADGTDGHGEEGKGGGDDDDLSTNEKAIIISLTVIVPVVVLLAVVVGIVIRLRISKRANKSRLTLAKVAAVANDG